MRDIIEPGLPFPSTIPASRAGVAPLAALALAACVTRLPAAPTPEPIPPRLAADAVPPAAGHGRLVIDVVDGPTPVQRVRMTAERSGDGQGQASFRFTESPEALCAASPCVAEVQTGNILLGFPVLGDPGTTEVELVHVDADPTVYRRSLSVYDDHTGALRVLGIIGASLGAASAITGTALLPVGLAHQDADLTWAGGITLGAGAVALALGIWAMKVDSPSFRPGSANHFPLPVARPLPPPPAPGDGPPAPVPPPP